MSEKYIRITNSFTSLFGDGDYAELSIPSSEFVNGYFGHDTGVLPPAVRWVSDTSPPSFIIERPPQTRAINYRKVKYNVSLPWTLFGIRFKDLNTLVVHTFCQHKSIQSFDDQIFVLPVPMANEEGLVEGFEYSVKLSDRRTIGSSLLQVIDKMFNTRTAKNFNIDVLPPSWGDIDTKSNRKIMEHWQTYNLLQARDSIEYYTSQAIPTVEALAEYLEAATEASTTFDYMTEVMQTVHESLKA